jgi:hypothetical protein
MQRMLRASLTCIVAYYLSTQPCHCYFQYSCLPRVLFTMKLLGIYGTRKTVTYIVFGWMTKESLVLPQSWEHRRSCFIKCQLPYPIQLRYYRCERIGTSFLQVIMIHGKRLLLSFYRQGTFYFLSFRKRWRDKLSAPCGRTSLTP